MKYQLIVSDRAANMLSDEMLFLAQVNSEAASKEKDIIIDSIRSLETMPERYPFLEANYIPANKYHKMVVSSTYLVLYQIRDAVVYVDFIVNCRKDYPWLSHIE